MCDPSSALLCLYLWLKCIKKFHDRATEEWPKYEKTLKEAAAFLSNMEQDLRDLMDSKFPSWDMNLVELGEKIKAGQLLLEQSKKLVDWEKAPSHGQAKGVGFAFRYSAVIENQRLLDICVQSLQGPQQRLELLKSNLRERKVYLQAKRRDTCAALARQYIEWG
jgi:hypothetical protein